MSAASVRIASATVAAKTETVLVTGSGLPLYRPDAAATSLVTCGLARLWPPLISPGIAAAAASGTVSVLNDVKGQQVSYNGHPLYTFADDHAGQGVEDFFVATLGLGLIAKSGGWPRPAPTVPLRGYGP
jgi:predicted lipoprotein with Yx(FWY)xxD motif